MPDNQISISKCSQCEITLLFVDSDTLQWKIKKITCRPCEMTYKIVANAVLPTIDIAALLKTLPGFNPNGVQLLMNLADTIQWVDQ